MKIGDAVFGLLDLAMFISDQFSWSRDPLVAAFRRRWRQVIVSSFVMLMLFATGLLALPDAASPNVFLDALMPLRLIIAKALFVGGVVSAVVLCVCVMRLWHFYDSPNFD